MTHKKYFGTDGIRGQVGQKHINAEFMLKLGFAAGMVFSKQGPAEVLIGRDTRISGDLLQSALQAGFASAGVDVRLLGVIPTPAVAHLTRSLRAQAGVVISASHNPYQDNGVKFFDDKGMKLSDEAEYEIEEKLSGAIHTVASNHLGTIKSIRDASGRYIEFCKSTFPTNLNLQSLKIVIDCANGAMTNIANKVLHELRGEVIAIHDRPDGYNINHQCGATKVADLQKAVVQHVADIGLAFDGDGDRLIAVDHLGEVVDGDEMLCILANDQHRQFPGIVGTVMSNLGLEQALLASKIDFYRANVGDRYVLEELLKRGWPLGGEASGHIVDLSITTTGDGIITALQMLRVMQSSKKSLHELKSRMTKRPQVLLNVPTDKVIDLKHYPKITDAVKAIELLLQDRGRVLLRPSGTEPVVRVMVEGNDEPEVKAVAQKLADVVAREISL